VESQPQVPCGEDEENEHSHEITHARLLAHRSLSVHGCAANQEEKQMEDHEKCGEGNHFGSLCSYEKLQHCSDESSKKQLANYQTEFCLNKKLALALFMWLQVLWKIFGRKIGGYKTP
jgi:hypothetical protein